MDKVELEFEFALNSPETKAEADQVKKSITGVGDTAEAQAKRVSKMVSQLTEAEQEHFRKLKSTKQAMYEAAAASLNKIPGLKPEANNLPKITEDIINLKKATEENTEAQTEGKGSILDLVGGMFSWAGVISFVTGYLLANRKEIIDWITTVWNGADAVDRLAASKKALLETEQEVAHQLAKEIADTTIAIDKINDKNTSLEKREDLLNQFINQNPSVLGALNLQNIATEQGTTLINTYIEALRKKIQLQQLEKGYAESLQKEADIESGKEVSEISTIGTALLVAKNFVTFSGDKQTEKDIEASNKRLKNQALEQQAIITKGYEDKLKAFAAGEKTQADAEDNSVKSTEARLANINNRLRNLQKGESAKTLKAQKEALEKEIKERNIALGLEQPDKPKNTKKPAADDAVKSRESLYRQLIDIQDKYTRKSFTKSEEEVQALKDQFKKMRIVVLEHNKNYPKQAISLAAFDELENTSKSDLVYRQNTEKLKQKLVEDKKLYEDFEAYKTALGTEKAKQRFAGQLNTEQTYLQKLQADYAIFYAQGVVGGFTAPVQERINFIQKQIDGEKKAEQKKQDDLLKSLISYSEERKVITEKYNKDLLAVGDNKEAAAELKKNYKLKLDVLDDAHIKELSSYKALFAGIENLSQEQAKKLVNDVRVMLKAAVAAGTISAELAKSITDKLQQTDKAIVGALPDKLIKIAGHLDGIAGNVSAINSEFGNLISNLANVLGQFANIEKLSDEFHKKGATSEEKFAAGANLVAVGIGAATSLVGMFISASKEREKAENEYYASVLKHQNDYNLALNEEIRLRTELSDNLFVKNLKGRIVDGTAALVDANSKYLKSIEDLNGGKAKLGQRNAVDAKTLIGGTGSGAILGAAIGSVVPVIGTAVGAIVGGIAGFIGGLFGGKKKKDIFGGLLQEYPELLQNATDGTVKFNEALAKSLIANNLVDDKTKALLENTIALAEARKAALEQINSVITDLAGNLGADLRNTLVNAFKDAEDASLAFGKTASGVLENIVSQMLFSEVFGDSFGKLEKEMKASYDIGGDGSFVDDITRFFSEAGPNIDAFNRGLEAAKEEAAKNGLNLFGSSKTDKANSTALTGAIRKEVTEESVGILTGVTRNTNDVLKQSLAVEKEHNDLLKENTSSIGNGLELMRSQQLAQLEIIAQNTGNTVTKLEKTIEVLGEIKQNTAPKLIPR